MAFNPGPAIFCVNGLHVWEGSVGIVSPLKEKIIPGRIISRLAKREIIQATKIE
jgi:hypothetical protein